MECPHGVMERWSNGVLKEIRGSLSFALSSITPNTPVSQYSNVPLLHYSFVHYSFVHHSFVVQQEGTHDGS
jgi:hypothetical protein